MPEDMVKVLCVLLDESIEVLMHVPSRKSDRYTHDPYWAGRGASYIAFTLPDTKVTHWMPLPQYTNTNLGETK